MLETKEEIEQWLDEVKIQNYSINEDLTVDVKGDVNIRHRELNKIPVQFGIIKGEFYCSGNNLTSLKGCPEIVKGEFDCSWNQLTSLDGSPKVVKGEFDCSGNNLTSLEYLPLKVEGEFIHDGIEEQGITESATLEELHQRNEIIKSKQTLEAEFKSKDLTKEEVKRKRMKI